MGDPAVADPNQGWVDVPETPAATAPPPAPAAGGADSGWIDVPEETAKDKPTTPPEKTPLGFGKNILTSGANLLTNVVKSIIPYDATNFNDAIPLKRASDSLFDLLWGTGRLAAKHMGAENLPMDPDSLKSDQAVQAMRDYVTNRYGSFDRFKDAWYQDPAGMAADLSTVLSGGAGLAKGVGLTRTAGALGKAAEISNPMFLPSKITSGAIRGLTRKPPPPPPEPEPGAFDPKTAAFTGEETLDPKTATFGPSPYSGYKSPQPPPPKAVETMQDAVQRLREAWGVKPPKSGLEEPPGATPQPKAAAPPPKPAAQPAPPPAPPAPARPAGWKDVTTMLAGAGIGGYALEHLTNHLLGYMGGGVLGVAAVKLLPKLLKSEAGQQMLRRLGPGSDTAAVAGVARDLVPALNSMYAYQQSMGQHSVLEQRATGGPINPELARLQRSRLPGIHDMLQRKN